MPELDAGVREYYDRGGEANRLDDTVELLRTKVLLERLVPEQATVLDVGGGFGVYATWLTARGHRVRLVDPVPLHVQAASAAGLDAVLGDARALPEPDASFDVVLLLGPLYHLPERTDRVRALAEAHRVARPGGLVVAALISRWASMYDYLLRNLIGRPEIDGMLREDLASGTRRGTQHVPFGFTTAYFHRPDEVAEEFTDAGLEFGDLIAIEGMSHWIPDVGALIADEGRRAVLLELLERTEREPAIVGATSHLLAVARRVG